MNVLLIEDERLTAVRLEDLLQKYDETIRVLCVIPSVKKAVDWLTSNPAPDLIFMDIHLEDEDCFQIFEQINLDTPVIFTTAYDAYMLQAFKVNSIDYLMKPVKYVELAASIDKFKRLHGEKGTDLTAILKTLYRDKQPEFKDRFMVSTGSRLHSIELGEVNYFHYAGSITFLVTRDDRRYPIEYSLDKLSAILNPKEFFRVNRQTMVSHKAVNNIHVFPKGRIKLDLQPEIKEDVLVSIDRVMDFKEWLGK